MAAPHGVVQRFFAVQSGRRICLFRLQKVCPAKFHCKSARVGKPAGKVAWEWILRAPIRLHLIQPAKIVCSLHSFSSTCSGLDRTRVITDSTVC